MGFSFASLDELGEGHGFRKIRSALGVEAFGVNAIVMPGGMEAFWHYHETQDELYFVHKGTARFEALADDGEIQSRELGEGGLFHAVSRTHRRVTNVGDDDLVILVIGASGGYVGRDGHLVDMADLPRRQEFGSGNSQE